MADILHPLFFVVVAGAAFLTLIALTLSNFSSLACPGARQLGQ